MKTLKNKKGITLIELVVGMLVFSILLTCVSAVMSPMLKSFIKANDFAEINNILDNTSAQLLSDLGNAVSAQVSGTTLTITTGASRIIYDVSAGILCRDGTPVLDAQYYKKKTMSVEYWDNDDQIHDDTLPSQFIVRVILCDSDGNQMAQRDYAVSPLGMA